MKISIGTNIKDGPWGGGNLFAINLKKFLEKEGHTVCTDLKDDDIDIILITEPRLTSESSAFTDTEVLKYLKYKNNQSIVVHRINECDERKNTEYVNKALIKANKVADYTVFVSNWLKELFLSQGIENDCIKVILGGADKKIFNSADKSQFKNGDKFKIVTHHWGNNWNKGFDIYSKLDQMLGLKEWSSRYEFTYIGNLPEDFNFKNTKYINPISGLKLASELKKNHIYLTASLNEPSGNHHIEAAQCGLPVLYIDSGGIPEYCNKFGVVFNNMNFEQKLKEITNQYSVYSETINNYPFNSDKMCAEYLELFEKLVKDKKTLIDKRNLPTIEVKDMVLLLLKTIYKKVR